MSKAESHNRSVQQIQSALVSLLASATYDSIQVKQLVAEAGVARATFYLHFSSKEEVLVSYIDSMFDEFFYKIEPSLKQIVTIDEKLAVLMFKTFKDNAEFSVVFKQPSLQPLLLKRFKGYLSRIVGHVARNNLPLSVPAAQIGFLIDYWAAGSLQMVSRWVSEDYQPDIEEMADTYAKLTISGFNALV